MDHSEIMGMITSPGSWEQVIYDVIAFEGLDPWDLDLKKLSEGFLRHIQGLQEMDFKVPAKYLMVASTLLRMKSDHLPLLEYFNQDENGELETSGEAENGIIEVTEEHAINPLTIPPRRVPRRSVVVSELVDALRKVLGTAERRELKKVHARGKIKIREDEIGKRISVLYDRINSILARIKGEEVKFSTLISKQNRPELANTFLPLVYLDHQKKVQCRQEEIFEEIFIKKGDSTLKRKGKAPSGKSKRTSKIRGKKIRKPKKPGRKIKRRKTKR